MKKKTIYLLVLACVTVLSVIVGTMYHMGSVNGSIFNVMNWISDDDEYGSDAITSETALDAFTEVNLDVDAADIIITTGDSYSLKFKGAENFRPEVTVENGVLTVSQTITTNKYKLNQTARITITVPSDTALDAVVLKCAAGDLDVTDLTATSLKLNCAAGDVDVIGGTIETLSLSLSAGDLDVEGCEFNDLTAELSAGDLDIQTIDEVTNYEISAEASLGSIEVNDHDEGDSYEQGGRGTKYINASVSLGDIDIQEQ